MINNKVPKIIAMIGLISTCALQLFAIDNFSIPSLGLVVFNLVPYLLYLVLFSVLKNNIFSILTGSLILCISLYWNILNLYIPESEKTALSMFFAPIYLSSSLLVLSIAFVVIRHLVRILRE